MPKIKILKNTVCGCEQVKKGDVVNASERDARQLINMGKASAYVEPQKPKKSS